MIDKFNTKTNEVSLNQVRNVFKRFLRSKRHNIIKAKDDALNQIETTLIDNTKSIFRFEVQKNIWTSENNFPFNSVSFTEDEKQIHDETPFYYVLISKNLKCAAMAHSTKIYKQENIEQSFINGQLKNFYRLPLSKCKFFKLEPEVVNNQQSMF